MQEFTQIYKRLVTIFYKHRVRTASYFLNMYFNLLNSLRDARGFLLQVSRSPCNYSSFGVVFQSNSARLYQPLSQSESDG